MSIKALGIVTETQLVGATGVLLDVLSRGPVYGQAGPTQNRGTSVFQVL